MTARDRVYLIHILEAIGQIEDFRRIISFIRRLREKPQRTTGLRMKLDWAGGLSCMGCSCTSVELQHRIADWWS